MDAWGALVGLLGMGGLLLVWSRFRATAPMSVSERVATQRGRPVREVRDLGPWGAYVALLYPPLSPRLTSGAKRSTQAGRRGGLPELRWDQMVWGGVGLAVGAVVGVAATLQGSTPITVVLFPAFGATVGVLLLDRRIRAQRHRRQARIVQQLPDVVELLAFAVAAGESLVPALYRVSRMTVGDLSEELRRVVSDAATGVPIEKSLRSASDRMGVASMERLVDALVISVERGTPLVDVLRAQANDARSTQQQSLMELAGKKDVAMLIPVVFLILPTVVGIALFPGIRGLQALTS